MIKGVRILIIVILFCLIFLFVLYFISNNKQLENNTEPIKIFNQTPKLILNPSSTPTTPTTPTTPEINTLAFSEDPELFKKQVAAQPAITKLIPLLPFKGRYFTLDYSLHSYLFTLKLDTNNRKAGMEEFGQFLRQHNIESSLLFTNLIIL